MNINWIRSGKVTHLVYLLPLFLLGSLNLVQAQKADNHFEFSMKEAVEYAVKNNSNAKNADLDVKIANKKVVEIRGIGLPQINGSAELDYNFKPATILFPSTMGLGTYQTLYQEGLITQQRYQEASDMIMNLPPQEIHFSTKYNMSAGASVSQLIFSGSYLVGLKAASTYVEMARKTALSTKIDVATNVTKAYLSVLVANKRVGLLDANIERLEKVFKETKAMYDAGFVEKLDVDRLEVALNNLKIEKSGVDRLITITNNLLKFQMGMPLDNELVLTDSLAEQNLPQPELMKPNYNKRVEYAMLQTGKALNVLEMKKNKSDYLPNLAAFATYTYQAQRDEFNFFDTDKKWFPLGIAGVKMSIPIFDGFQKSARIQQSRLNIQKIDNQLENLKMAIDMQVSNAAIQYENNFNTLNNMKKNLDLAKEVVRVTQIKYQEGVGSNIEVITAESALKEAQTNYFSSLYDLMISKVELDKAYGTLY